MGGIYEVRPSASIYILSFINIRSDIQNLGGGGKHRHTGILRSLLSFQNKESRLKMRNTALDCGKREADF
jgi:hypothetical protein